MNFLGKIFGGIIATGAFLFAGVLLVTCMMEAVQSIWLGARKWKGGR